MRDFDTFLAFALQFGLPALILIWALWWLRKRSREGNPTLGRSVALGVLVLAVVGFGLCGAAGTVVGTMTLMGDAYDRGWGWIFVMFGLPGLVLAAVLFGLMQHWRKLPPPAEAGASDAPQTAQTPDLPQAPKSPQAPESLEPVKTPKAPDAPGAP